MLSSIIRQTTVSTRLFGTSAIASINASRIALFPGTAASVATELSKDKKAVASKKQELTKLKSKLTKEKTTLKKLETKLKTEGKKLDAKLKVRAEKERAAALKSFKKISGYTFYIKENKGNSLVDSAARWNVLSEQEKENYSRKADEYNEEVASIYAPRPKKPVEGYALFVKENFVNDGRTVPEISKTLGQQWKTLSDSEKGHYKISQDVKDSYAKKLDQWKQDRFEAYNSNKKA